MYRQNNSGLQIVEIEITNRCNLNCKHCYVDKSLKKDLAVEKIKNLIRQFNELGINRLVLTGGEPLLHNDIFRIANYAKKIGIPELALFTNGILIDETNLNDLKIFDFIQLSIDNIPGKNPLLRIDYSRNIEQKIILLKSANITVTLMATLSKSSYKDTDILISFAKKHDIKISFNKLAYTDNEQLKSEYLTPQEIKQAFQNITIQAKKYQKIGCSDPLLFLVDTNRRKHYDSIEKQGVKGGCTAGIATMYITVDEKVYPCPFLKIIAGDTSKENIKKIWETSQIFHKLRNRNNLTGSCGSCENKQICGGCRAAAHYFKGDITGEDPNCFKRII